MLPPSWRAAPSRPALPPKRWVSTVPVNISGATRFLTGSPFIVASRTAFAPRSSFTPQARYMNTMIRPPTGSRQRSQGYASRSSCTKSTE